MNERRELTNMFEELEKAWAAVEASEEWKASEWTIEGDADLRLLKNAYEAAREETCTSLKILQDTEEWKAWNKADQDYFEDYPDDRDEEGDENYGDTEELNKVKKLEEKMKDVRPFGADRSYYETYISCKEAKDNAELKYHLAANEARKKAEDAKEALINSAVFQDHVAIKKKYLSMHMNYDGGVPYAEASVAYMKVWEETKDHEKAMEVFNKIVSIDSYMPEKNRCSTCGR